MLTCCRLRHTLPRYATICHGSLPHHYCGQVQILVDQTRGTRMVTGKQTATDMRIPCTVHRALHFPCAHFAGPLALSHSLPLLPQYVNAQCFTPGTIPTYAQCFTPLTKALRMCMQRFPPLSPKSFSFPLLSPKAFVCVCVVTGRHGAARYIYRHGRGQD